ncbi:hypothetical protein NUH30_19390 [Leptospira sp. 85282-16]|uniref:hypothetical protein n=1 Tax=Leptospira sp. 85282-16 TaxID=2971256 RepID=UPI0021C0814C|nr:hypothetical protein [Leptospira sp. 85282-16]MCT8335860.1 hypothetical protein [Leptospira sp. 85282-16]
MKIFTIIVFCILSNSLLSEKNNKFLITPNKFRENDIIEIRFPKKPPLETAIIRPDGVVVYTDEFFKKNGYPSIKKLKVKVSNIFGLVYIDGNETKTKVFNRKGKYEFYFADNLETDMDNTYSNTYTVHFLGN